MLENKEWETLNDLIAELYGIKNSRAMRKAFLTRLMTLIDFDLADFDLAEQGRVLKHRLTDPIVVSIFDRSKEEAFIGEYEAKYYELDYVNWLFSYHESIVYKESDLIDSKIRKKSEFYRDYLLRHDLGNVAGVVVISAGKLVGAITLYKSEGKGDFGAKDIYILQMLLPHLRNVLCTKQELEENCKAETERLLKYQYSITKKEWKILSLMVQGYSNEEISRINHVSMNTTKCHISNIFAKIGVKSRTQLVCFLFKNGFGVNDDSST